ncbi:proline-rich protein PRCC [Cynoglossus semilaevis]|uniref:Proline rich mitotic checkpoint control factor n=1 Tax=Cynoglossus semilaevis TaxID=244447 RepID=A0A3P8VEI1_CYNSE|nr:proline-rich protein PRCC [Cynoglossus semilaevis]
MSLVAYASSDDSDSEETSTTPAPPSKFSSTGLFSLLPAPKKSASAPRHDNGPNTEIRMNLATAASVSNDELEAPKRGFFSSLPKPKKRTEPVKITVPQIQRRDSDSDDDDVPAKKKLQSQGSGLSALLPQPKNLTVKEIDRPLIPHALTKRQEPKKPATSAQGQQGSSASPSAIKAAAKSAALQLARQIAADDQDNEDMTPQNYFSLGESSPPLPAAVPTLDPQPLAPVEPVPSSAPTLAGQSDAPLDFGCNQEGADMWGNQYPSYQQPMAGPEGCPEGYYNEGYFQDPSLPSTDESEDPGPSAMFDEEGFMRLQGKRNRGKEEVKFLEIKGDDQLSGNQQWMTKNLSEEKQTRQSFSKKRGGQPTGQQRRKHQITYLIHQAKERELELKNSWAENKLSRRQTQAKYGF